MTVDGDVDHGVEGAVEFGRAVGLDRACHVGEQRLARAAGDEHAVAKAVAPLVRVVEPLELGGDVQGVPVPSAGVPVRRS